MSKQFHPFGLWPSPLAPAHMAAEKRLQDVDWDDATGALVWLEGRSGHGMILAEQGEGQAPRELNGTRSARAGVGYGGGDMAAAAGWVWFAAEGRLYRQPLSPGADEPLTPAFGDAASATLSPDGRWLLYVHTYEGTDRLALVDAQGAHWPMRLAEGHHFYMQPAWHPDSQRIAWIAWDHPQMPWDGTLLYLAQLGAGAGLPSLVQAKVIAGDADTSLLQPAFAPHGRYLAYVSDASGWYNLYLYDLESQQHMPLVQVEAELGVPAWAQGMRTYAWAPDGASIYYIESRNGYDRLCRVELASGRTTVVPGLEDYAALSQPSISPQGILACIASAPQIPPRIVTLDPATGATRIVARASGETVPAEVLAVPEAIEWMSEEGDTVHGLYYAPRQASGGSARPPLVVLVHGGPTGQATAAYSGQVQFLATRGYAVLALNYRGSSGYGRAYRNALRGQWGLYDADDAVSGARHLVGAGLVDGERLVIMGGSAGGYTVLQTLIRYPGVFRAGVCLYGVTNLFTLASDTHKFEQRYLDSLIGPLPERAARYRERSPSFYADCIRDPLILFQGEEDRVVPPTQAQEIVVALQRNGVPHEYHLYPGEGHGWRKAETIARFYETLERFLKQYLVYH